MSLSRTMSETLSVGRDLKPEQAELGVIQGYWKLHHSIDRIRDPIGVQ